MTRAVWMKASAATVRDVVKKHMTLRAITIQQQKKLTRRTNALFGRADGDGGKMCSCVGVLAFALRMKNEWFRWWVVMRGGRYKFRLFIWTIRGWWWEITNCLRYAALFLRCCWWSIRRAVDSFKNSRRFFQFSSYEICDLLRPIIQYVTRGRIIAYHWHCCCCSSQCAN